MTAHRRMAGSARTAGSRGWTAAVGFAVLASGCATGVAGLPTDPGAAAHYSAGTRALGESRFDVSVRELSQAATIEPTSASVRLNLGWAYFYAGAHGDAEREFGLAVALNPDHPRSHLSLASALYVQGRFGEAATAYERCVAAAGGPAASGDSAIFQALSLKRAGGASATKAADLLSRWTSTLGLFSTTGDPLRGPLRTLARYLAGRATELEVEEADWADDFQRSFARYVVAADHIARGDLAGARQRLEWLLASTPSSPLGFLHLRALAEVDLKRLP